MLFGVDPHTEGASNPNVSGAALADDEAAALATPNPKPNGFAPTAPEDAAAAEVAPKVAAGHPDSAADVDVVDGAHWVPSVGLDPLVLRNACVPVHSCFSQHTGRDRNDLTDGPADGRRLSHPDGSTLRDSPRWVHTADAGSRCAKGWSAGGRGRRSLQEAQVPTICQCGRRGCRSTKLHAGGRDGPVADAFRRLHVLLLPILVFFTIRRQRQGCSRCGCLVSLLSILNLTHRRHTSILMLPTRRKSAKCCQVQLKYVSIALCDRITGFHYRRFWDVMWEDVALQHNQYE